MFAHCSLKQSRLKGDHIFLEVAETIMGTIREKTELCMELSAASISASDLASADEGSCRQLIQPVATTKNSKPRKQNLKGNNSSSNNNNSIQLEPTGLKAKNSLSKPVRHRASTNRGGFRQEG